MSEKKTLLDTAIEIRKHALELALTWDYNHEKNDFVGMVYRAKIIEIFLSSGQIQTAFYSCNAPIDIKSASMSDVMNFYDKTTKTATTTTDAMAASMKTVKYNDTTESN